MLRKNSPMKKLVSALALSVAFAAPMAFFTSGAKAETMTQSHATKSVAAKSHTLKQDKASQSVHAKVMKKGKKKMRRRTKM